MKKLWGNLFFQEKEKVSPDPFQKKAGQEILRGDEMILAALNPAYGGLVFKKQHADVRVIGRVVDIIPGRMK